VRCIRLDGIGYEHCFPKFGFCQINETRNQQEFKIPDPPNHEKKRKDEIYDITSISTQGRNLVNIFQTQKDHKGFYGHPGHIIAIFLVKIIQPHDIVNFIKSHRTEDLATSLQRYRSFFGGTQNNGSEVAMIENHETEQVTINLADSITMLPINVPARGEICSHLQCFDLETYITLNAKHKRWLCPFCNKRSSYVMIDPFFLHILDQMKPLRDKVKKIDDKITMFKNLSITFTQDNGKFQGKYEAVIEDNTCKGYQLIQSNSQEKKDSPTSAGADQASTEVSNNQTENNNSQNQA